MTWNVLLSFNIHISCKCFQLLFYFLICLQVCSMLQKCHGIWKLLQKATTISINSLMSSISQFNYKLLNAKIYLCSTKLNISLVITKIKNWKYFKNTGHVLQQFWLHMNIHRNTNINFLSLSKQCCIMLHLH